MRILKISTLMFSQSLTLLLNLSIQIILAKYYSTKDTGVYFSIFALTNILSTIGLYGINKYYIYIKSKSNNISTQHIKDISQIFICINIICMITLLVWGNLKFPEYPLFIIGNMLVILLSSLIAIITSIVQIKNKVSIISILQMLTPFIKVMGLLIGFYILNNYFRGYSLIVILLSLLSISILYKSYISKYKINLLDMNGDYFSIFKTLTPYACLNILFTIYTQGNTFYLGILETPEKAAYFAIAYLFVNTIFIFPTSIYQKVLAHRLLRLVYNDRLTFNRVYASLQELVILSSSVCIILVYIFSDDIITLLFGEKYFESIKVLNYLLLFVPFRLITVSIGTILSTNENIMKRIQSEIILCFINIVVNFTFIPLFGIVGAIASVIITEFFLAVFFTLIIEKNYKVHVNRYTYLSFVPICILIILNVNLSVMILVELFVLILIFRSIKRRIKFVWKNI